MEFKPDEALGKIDRLYVKTEKLIHDYREFCDGASREIFEQCIRDIEELKGACPDVGLDMEQLLGTLECVLPSAASGENMQEISDILEMLKQSIRKEYLIRIHSEGSYTQVKVENYFGTAYPKTALIIYIVYPFLFPGTPLGHTNQQEVMVMAELLKEHGYNVDIINTGYAGDLEGNKYDLVIGSGKRFEALLSERGRGGIYLYYLTESSPYFGNPAELKRLQYFSERNHRRFPFERLADTRLKLEVLAKADAAVCVGNEWTVSTYEGMFPKIYPLDISGFQISIQPDFGTDVRTMTRNFMWYGGTGPVHKGLDLAIEAFRELPELKLHIVGEPHAQFYDFYRKDIEEAENIYYYGFLNKDSEQFLEVCRTCAYCISLSCAEGQSTSVLTSMFAGMIPVCTVQTGIDLDKCGGIWIGDIKVEQVASLLKKLSKLPEDEVRRRREKAYNYVCSEHTLKSYRKNLEYIFNDLMGHTGKRGV